MLLRAWLPLVEGHDVSRPCVLPLHLQLQVQAQAQGVVELRHQRGGRRATTGPTRSTVTERTCSAWALEYTRSPVSSAASRVWNGKTRLVARDGHHRDDAAPETPLRSRPPGRC